jgi:hypothetical protein
LTKFCLQIALKITSKKFFFSPVSKVFHILSGNFSKIIRILNADLNVFAKFSTIFSTDNCEFFPHFTEKIAEKKAQNLKYFLLDNRKSGYKISDTVKIAYGLLTGSGRGKRSGDAPI